MASMKQGTGSGKGDYGARSAASKCAAPASVKKAMQENPAKYQHR